MLAVGSLKRRSTWSRLALLLTVLFVLGQFFIELSEQASDHDGADDDDENTKTGEADQLDSEGKPIKKVSGDEFHHFMRPRLGYFAKFPPTNPYFELFSTYFHNVVTNNDAAMKGIEKDPDDWRQRRPHAEFCIETLIGFQTEDYVLSKPYDLIPLDACLEWLFDESRHKEMDLKYLSKKMAKEIKDLKLDPKFKELFESTGFRDVPALQKKWPKKLLTNIYDYLVKLLKINNDNPTSGCHSLWQEAYNDFIENVYVGDDCDDENDCQFYGIEEAAKDSYLTLIADSTKHSATTCYGVMQQQMHDLIVQEYESSKWTPATFKKKFITKTNRVDKQSEHERWSREMIGILQIASGIDSDQPINLGEAVQALDKIKNADADTIQRFTKTLAEYALNNADMKASANDPKGSARYGRAMTKLCRPYIDPENFLPKSGGASPSDPDDEEEAQAKPFEFYNLIYSLVRTTNHEPLFGISKDKLEDDIVQNGWEALYLATFACQIISTTWGTVDNVRNSMTFKVSLKKQAHLLIDDWPIEVLTVKLPILYPKQEVSSGFEFPKMRAPKLLESFQQKHQPSGEKTKSGKGLRKTFGKLFKKTNEPEHQHQDHAPMSDFVSRLPAEQQQDLNKEAPYDFGHSSDGGDSAPVIRAAPKPVFRPAATSESAVSQPAPTAKPIPKNVLPLKSILYYKDLHGRYPFLPADIHEIYPELPKDLSGTYPKLSVEELKAKYPIENGWRVAKGPFENHEKQQQQQQQQQQQATPRESSLSSQPEAPAKQSFARPRGTAMSERISRFEQPAKQQEQPKQQQQQAKKADKETSADKADKWDRLTKMKI